MTATLTAPAPTTERHGSGALLAILLAGVFMAIVDLTIVNVALPTMRRDLDASGAQLQLVVAGYMISYAVLLVTGARIGDRIGHGRAFRIGLAVFTLASLACGLAPSAGALIAFRFVQGAGAAAMMPQVMSLLQTAFEGAARARALGWYSAVIAGATVVGQVCGGLLVGADLFGEGWRPVFMVNVPIGAALLVLARRRLPVGATRADRRLDPLGVVTLCAAVLLLVLPLVLGHEEHWPAWCWACLAASVPAFAVFALAQRSVAARGGAPLISSRVLRAPGLAMGLIALFVALATYGGFLFAFTLHLQAGLGEGAARAGLTFAPLAVGFGVSGLTWQRLPASWHGRMIPVGLAVTIPCYLVLALIMRSGHAPGVGVFAILAVLGVALGVAFSPIIGEALRHVPRPDAADASGALTTTFQLGQVVGVATLGTLYLTAVGSHTSGHAIAMTFVALAAATVLAVICAAVLVRRRPVR